MEARLWGLYKEGVILHYEGDSTPGTTVMNLIGYKLAGFAIGSIKKLSIRIFS